MPEVLLAAFPLILLVGSLLLGLYPGHRAIVRLSERIAARCGRRPATAKTRRPLPPLRFAPSGGLLLACGIASRPPPLSL
jgi:hypothetical protein